MTLFEKVASLGVLPVVKLNRSADALPLAEALEKGGLPAMEITFRTDAAADSISAVCKNRPDVLVGAGTVLTPDQANQAVSCGASFIVSPGLNPKVVEWCLSHDVPVIPGIVTPTELEAAMGYGLQIVKFFPAEAFGGLKTLKAMAAPYGAVKFMPTGGISLANLEEYLRFPKILACGGSYMVKEDFITSKDWNTVTDLCAQTVGIIKKVRG